jgi:hypothetical protein
LTNHSSYQADPKEQEIKGRYPLIYAYQWAEYAPTTRETNQK